MVRHTHLLAVSEQATSTVKRAVTAALNKVKAFMLYEINRFEMKRPLAGKPSERCLHLSPKGGKLAELSSHVLGRERPLVEVPRKHCLHLSLKAESLPRHHPTYEERKET
jgi:hypothetical protein